MAALGVREVTLIGGEAYLREDWLEVVAEIARQGMTPTMTTGGRGIDAGRARAAQRAGLQSVSVSIDGLAATHDRQPMYGGGFRPSAGNGALDAGSPDAGSENDAGNDQSPGIPIYGASFPVLGIRMFRGR
jgi:MoaA/NifB/PqqE/SkfB family radical SAM enzyme